MVDFNFVFCALVLFVDNVFTRSDNWRYGYGELPSEAVRVEQITAPLILGEGPHWDSKQQVLWFVDINGHSIHKYDPATKTHTKTTLVGDEVSFIIPVEGTWDEFVVGVGQQFQVIRWDGRDGSPALLVRVLADVDRGLPTVTNDAKCDPKGRLFAGTEGIQVTPWIFELHNSSLYRLEGTNIRKLVDHVSISNGMAWDLRAGAFYYTDSEERKIRRYDYDVATGDISPYFDYVFDFKRNDGLVAPDGFTIDTNGNLWIATFGGACIINVDPRTGALLRKVPIPAELVTSATFGGINMNILFVTTGNLHKPDYIGESKNTRSSGSTFMVTGLGVRGYRNVNFKLY